MPVCTRCGHEATGAFRFCPECGAEQAASDVREQRRTVTVVFCDLAGSTALGESVDPERLRALLAAYFERMKAVVESHGGTVEKFIGDAVMAVFGVPVAHEDDALRAVRAAAGMRDILPTLGLQGRIGVMTGEVVTGTAERLATGDAVNVAARLEQAAAPGEVLIGEPTLALVRAAVETEPVEPLALKGKSRPVPAHRLLRVLTAPERRHDTPFVGRDADLGALREAWERVCAERRCELVTILGEAGVGKSRLARELLRGIEGKVIQGRCLPYGEGITYWPVVEMLVQLDTLPPDEAAAAAIRSLLGQSDAATTADEIAWAFRKTLEHAAAAGPVAAVFDDIQWGERTLHDLIEHVALLSTGAPILLLCMARPELTEHRPAWPVTVHLEPLRDADVQRLLPEELAGDLRERIVHAAGGNPLFVGEMLAVSAETEGDVVVPPTLTALLAARLDQLDPAERSVLERAAVEGEIFHRGAVQALLADDVPVLPLLATLARKQLVAPERPLIAAEDGFRFHHLLIRDVAYEGLPKSVRIDLHQRLASWLDDHGSALVEVDELVGYHLERAHAYRSELDLPRDSELAAAARRHLADAGRRAADRQDYRAAAGLLLRAADLDEGTIDVALEVEIGDVLHWLGEMDEAARRADSLAERAAAASDRVGELCGTLLGDTRRLGPSREDALDLEARARAALPVLESAGDDMALSVAYQAIAESNTVRCRFDAALEAMGRAYAHARLAGHEPAWMRGWLALCRFSGTTPVAELLDWLDGLGPDAERDQFVRAYRSWSLARLGRFDEARAVLAEARVQQAERGGGLLLANLTAFESVWVELLADEPEAAAAFGAEGCRLHEELGHGHFLAFALAVLAEALYAAGRLDEAQARIDRARDLAFADDVWMQALVRRVRAKLLAQRGEHAEARLLAREAVEIAEQTDMVDQQGGAWLNLAEVLQLAGDLTEAAAALEQALDRYERKGNVVMAGRARSRLAGLQGPAA